MKYGSARILVVDDEENIREVFRLLLEQLGHDAIEAQSGEAALAIVANSPPDLILLDMTMGGVSGLEVVKRLKGDERTRAVPVIMVTGVAERHSRLKALEGGAEDYLTKPVDPPELAMKVRNLLRLKEVSDRLADLNRTLEARIHEKTAELVAAHRQAIILLTSATEYRDEATGSHVRRLSRFSAILAKALGADDEFQNALYYASPMHDIGKIGIPDRILLKPGPLSEEEWRVMQTHTTLGERILRNGSSAYIRMGAVIARTHHEKWDGTGYPDGLRGGQIPVEGRLVFLCDIYDALRSRRPYKSPMSHREAVDVIQRGDGRARPSDFCPEVLEAFRKVPGGFRSHLFRQRRGRADRGQERVRDARDAPTSHWKAAAMSAAFRARAIWSLTLEPEGQACGAMLALSRNRLVGSRIRFKLRSRARVSGR